MGLFQASIVLALAVASASATHVGLWGYGHHEAHIPSGSVSVGHDGVVIAGPSGSVHTDNGLHGHGAGAHIAGPSGDVGTHGGHARIAGPGHDHEHYGVHHVAAVHHVPAVHAVHAVPYHTHAVVAGPTAHATIVGPSAHATIVAPSAHAHHGVYHAVPAVHSWGHHGVVAHGLVAHGHHGW